MQQNSWAAAVETAANIRRIFDALQDFLAWHEGMRLAPLAQLVADLRLVQEHKEGECNATKWTR
ncbi:MAG: hypothetical protein WC683_08105 [bacterium]